uniref:Uncharacterized protein n=1 Tax=Cannabis sativa TaxID=3483 RepID=A0A803PKM9_CANSA
MNDSRTEDCSINPNQENTVDRYRRFLQEISEGMDVDFESMFKGPPKADKKSRKKIVQADEVANSTKEPKRPKTKAYTKRSSSQPVIDVDKISRGE